LRRCLQQSLSRVVTSIAKIFRGRNYYGRYQKMYTRDLRAVPSLRLISSIAQGTVLDVGCGVGWLSRLFGDYVGVDINREAISIAKKRSKREFVIADALNLPFRSQIFDTCILYDVIEHLSDVNRALLEVRRVSDKVLISCADFSSYYRFFTYDETHQKLLEPNELFSMLKNHFTHIRFFRTSGVFMAPRLVNNFLGKYFPNQIVLSGSL